MSSDSPTQEFLSALAQTTGQHAQQNDNGWMACCPAHEDRTPSLSISTGKDGRVLLKCFAGCTAEAVCEAVGLKVADLMPPANNQTQSKLKKAKGKGKIVATYDYRDAQGNLLFQVCRMEPKDFRQRRPDGKGGWAWSVKDVRQVPYRLPELLAEPTRPVIIVEGEKDVERLAKEGVVAICNAGGAGKWKPEFAEYLRGRKVLILPDNDDPGRQHAEQVARSLQGIAAVTCILNLPDLPPKGDVSDWFNVGGTVEKLKELVKAAPTWNPDSVLHEWPEIDSLETFKVPEFPVDALPETLREWVSEESHATQTPADLAGLLAIAVCSATIARRVEVEPRPGWKEPVNVYVAALLGPGNRKSQVFNDATKPLREIEAELIEAEKPSVARELSERRQDEARMKKLEKVAAEKGDASARQEAGEIAAELAMKPEAVLPRLMVDDATSEKLGMMLAEQGGRIASMSPEGGVFDLMAGMYSSSGIPQFGVYLMGHSGDDLITDRVGRKTVRVPRPALTCGYAMQPVVIEGLAENKAFRGRGLLARFLYAAPESWIGEREIAPTPVSLRTKENYRNLIRSLAVVETETILTLSLDAQNLLMEWEAEIEDSLADGGAMELMRDWGAKLAGATLRLAAIFHCARHHGPSGQMDRQDLESAIEVARFLIPHAAKIFHMMQAMDDSTDEDARYVLKWIKRHQKTEFTKSEAQHHGKRRFPKSEDIDKSLGILTNRGYIRPKPTSPTGPGRPPSPAYEVNPAVFTADENRSHNSHNPTDHPKPASSGNNGNTLGKDETQNRIQVTI